MKENYTHWEDPVPVPLIKELMISTHSSAVTAVDKVRKTALERHLPDVRLQAKSRQYLKLGRRSFSKRKQNYMKFLLKDSNIKKKRKTYKNS